MEAFKDIFLYVSTVVVILLSISVSYSIITRGEVVFRFTSAPPLETASGSAKIGMVIGNYVVQVLEIKR